MTPTLLVLAAGMGSRYGGLKQLDPFGPNGETIIDYSVYDAARAGFGKVVFVIRRDFADEFREKVSDKYKNRIEVRTVFQGLENIPEGYTLHPERKKPLGTGHAVWCASKEISEPFAVINADDFYGPAAFRIMAEHLSTLDDCSQKEQTMVGYKLTNTLSENGSVSRGVCEIEEPRMHAQKPNRTHQDIPYRKRERSVQGKRCGISAYGRRDSLNEYDGLYVLRLRAFRKRASRIPPGKFLRT